MQTWVLKRGNAKLTRLTDSEFARHFRGNGDPILMSNDAPVLTSLDAARGMAGGVRPVGFTVMMTIIITTRRRDGSG